MTRDGSEKTKKLKEYFRKLESAAIAFSGGVDSSVLAKTAHEALGEKAVSFTIDSPTLDRTDLEGAIALAKEMGIKHRVIRHDELKNECFRRNEKDRCYHCKKEMLTFLKKAATDRGIKTVIEGTNAEEILGHRPGYKAVKEAGVSSPLAELGYTKKDIREIASYLKLPNAHKPSKSCLASRIPYGTGITKELLDKVSKAESSVRLSGVTQLRVRCFDDNAVIEVLPEDCNRIFQDRARITKELKALGFKRVTLDLEGYVTGSMNR